MEASALVLVILLILSSKFVFSLPKIVGLFSIKSSDFPHDFNNSLSNVSFAFRSSNVLTNKFFF